MKKIAIAYIPVLHEGYRKFIDKHKDVDTLYVLGKEITSELPYLSKEIRQLDPELIKKSLDTWNIVKNIEILNKQNLDVLSKRKISVIMPNEDVCKMVWEKYFPKHEVTLDSIFLRWDKHNAVLEKPVIPEKRISRKDFDKKVLGIAEEESQKSSDWWRRVGAVLVKNGEVIILAHNTHIPSEHTPYINGDPRNAFHKGVHLELGTSIHAEAKIIAEAAKKGISLEGTGIYVTVFPCPPCAKLIAHSGIRTLYCAGGYGILDGEDVLKSHKVKIIFVE
ncbi:MAG: deaminase [bacterium]|nr:deaminase [bacterium]